MDPKFVLESFWQRKSNCACVAFIKVLLLGRRTSRAFLIQRSGRNIFITLSDKRAIVLTKKEIDDINRGNAISFRRPRAPQVRNRIARIRAFVELCFAVLVRSMQLSGFDGREYTQQDAVKALTREGVETTHFHKLLGLERSKRVRVSSRSLYKLVNADVALIYNDRHITAGARGYYEDFGKAIAIAGTVPVLQGKPAKAWYQLEASVQ